MTVSVEEAKQKLEELLQKALAGEAVEILFQGKKAKLLLEKEQQPSALLGSQKGVPLYMGPKMSCAAR